MIMKTTIPITLILIIVLAIPYSIVSALGNSYNSSTPLSSISLNIWGKNLSWEQIQDLLDTATTKRYTKLGYIDGTPVMLQKKQEYYSKILKVLETWYNSEKVQSNNDMKQLYEVLYRVIKVSHKEITKEYDMSLKSPGDAYFNTLFESLSEAEKKKGEVQKKLDIERAKIDKTDLYERKYKEYKEYFENNPDKATNLDSGGFFSTGFSGTERDAILNAKAAVGAEIYKIITDDFEKQILRFDTNYHGLTPSYDMHLRWNEALDGIKKVIKRVEEWPKLDGDIDIQTELIYKYKVDLYNLYIWVLIDGWLVTYPQDFTEKLWIYKTYIQPYDFKGGYTEYKANEWPYKQYQNFESYKSYHQREVKNDIFTKNTQQVLGYFGYSINLDENSSSYLQLSYDASKNKARWQIDYIENIWK